MKMVYEAGNVIDAHRVRHALELAGSPAFVNGKALLGGVGELPACGMVAGCVPVARWAVLRALPFQIKADAADPRNTTACADAGPSLLGAV